MVTPAASRTADLVPFVPRLTLEWLRDAPEERWRELDGTLAFVDISGFTAMSERLSTQGKAGAEEVTEAMNATFASLLDTAYAEGGQLLKFGGDALLLFYSGADHAARAARAAHGMRRGLRVIGRRKTSAGTVQLRMHAGINSGRFQFFLVGESHRELLVTGPATTRTAEMEGISEAGEIVVSPETAQLLDAGVLGDEKGDGRLLRSQPGGEGAPVPRPDLDGIAVEVAVPAPLRAQLLEVGPLEGEHRQAAVAFVRFSGVDEVIDSEGADAVADGLDALVTTIQAAAAEHGVTFLESDLDRDGGRIVLVAGAPQTLGENEERLLRALRAAMDEGLPFPVHVGASRGRVFTGQVGTPFRRTYTLLGDTAALAARLMARAGEDEILVAADAFERGGAAFASTPLEPFYVKGKTEPVDAVALGDLAERPVVEAPAALEKPPLVGRDRERAILTAAITPVRAGFGTFVELIGEPGMGKSRLAEELQEQCADMTRLTARCEQYEATTPYYPFRSLLLSLLEPDVNGDRSANREALAARLRTIDEELVPWAPLLAAPLGIEVESTPEVDQLDPAFWRARLHGVVGRVLDALLATPTLLLFEDVHWMDEASADLLRFLGGQVPGHPWLACTTRRGVQGGFAAADGTPPVPALSLQLEPLGVEDAKTLARAAAGDRRVTDQELDAIAARAAGNPLFLQELAASEEAAEDVDLPETVEVLVATRIDRLAPADRALLRWAAVLGASFSGTLVEDVLEGDPTVAAASEAWDRLGEFVERDPHVPGGFRFRHALVRDAAYEGLSYKRRRELHERVARVLERRRAERPEDAAELLSLHFHRAEQWPEAWKYSVEAGQRAAEKYANVEAAQFFERALESAKNTPDLAAAEVASVAEALGDVRMRMGDYESAGTAYRSSRASTSPNALEQARLIQKEAIVPLRLGRYPQALRRLSQALRTLEDLEDEGAVAQRARLFGWYASVLQHQRRPRAAIEWCQRAASEAERSNARDALAQADFILDWAYVALGQREQAVYSTRAIEIYEELGDFDRLAWVLNNLGGYVYLDGRWDEALELAQRARAAFEKIGDETHAADAALNIAEVQSDQGKTEEADAALRSILELRRDAGLPLAIAETASLLGRLAARTGNFDEARSLLDEARTLYAAEGDEIELLTTDARIVESLVLQGRSADAIPIAVEALERAETMPGVSVVVASLHRLLGWAHLQAGDFDAARGALEQSLRLARLEDENFGIRSADYEIALTLDAVAQLARVTGEATDDLEAERDEILGRLGVQSLPTPPVG